MTDEKRLFRAIHYNLDNEPEETFSYIYEKYNYIIGITIYQKMILKKSIVIIVILW